MRSFALVLAFFALSATAQAWTPPPTADEARLEAYLPIARAAWPDSLCAGQENVQVNVPLPDGARGEQDPGTCTVRIAAGLTAGLFCDALVHELGHAAGYGHTDDPTAVHAPAGPWAYLMNSTSNAWPDWPACVAAITPPLRYRAETEVRAQLPWGGYGWTVTCTPMRGPARCRAARCRARDRRFAIRMVGGHVIAARRIYPASRP